MAILPRPCPRTQWNACLSTTSLPGATTRPSRRPVTGVCLAQSPRTHRHIGSARGLVSLAPRRMLPPLNPATTGIFPIYPLGYRGETGSP